MAEVLLLQKGQRGGEQTKVPLLSSICGNLDFGGLHVNLTIGNLADLRAPRLGSFRFGEYER